MDQSEQSLNSLIRDFIARELLYSPGGFPYDDDASFLNEGIVDSLGVMELVGFVQSTFGVEVEQQDIVPDNFDSVAQLAAFVKKKLGTGPVRATGLAYGDTASAES